MKTKRISMLHNLSSLPPDGQIEHSIFGTRKIFTIADPKSILAATRTPPTKKTYGAKRAGAKAVKRAEKLSEEFVLAPEDATVFRALSARSNYLSQDRADIGFATKELCREFSVPTRLSQQRLKRLGRYLAGKPRLVHRYPWGTGIGDDDHLEIYADTDFAGCGQTRRSTSGESCC